MKLLNQFTNGNFEKVYEEVITLIEMNENSLKKKVNDQDKLNSNREKFYNER